MTISSSLSAGVAGLSSQASKLATISDNIANSSTNGYRRVQTEFHSVVNSFGQAKYSAGGVRVTSTRLISEGGTLTSTSNATDLAVRGKGMLPVTSVTGLAEGVVNEPRLTTTGSFRLNQDGFLTTSGGLALMGWPARPDGTIPPYPQDSFNALTPIRLNANEYSGEETTRIAIQTNLPAVESEAGAAGDTRSLSIEYFDTLAKPQSLEVSFTPTVPATGASNEWTMIIRDGASGGAVVGQYTLNFNTSAAAGGTLQSVTATSGGAYDPTTGSVTINAAHGPIDVSLGKLNESGGMTQVADRYVPGATAKDGFPAGNLIGVEVDKQGYVRANYDNGSARTVAQIPLVDVPNVNGLNSHDDQTYSVSKDSGNFLLWRPGDGPVGEVMGFALEESATDVARELTDLIQTQRAYSSNAKIIQTVDEMLQETTNMKR